MNIDWVRMSQACRSARRLATPGHGLTPFASRIRRNLLEGALDPVNLRLFAARHRSRRVTTSEKSSEATQCEGKHRRDEKQSSARTIAEAGIRGKPAQRPRERHVEYAQFAKPGLGQHATIGVDDTGDTGVRGTN